MNLALKACVLANLSNNVSKVSKTQANVTQAIIPPIQDKSTPPIEFAPPIKSATHIEPAPPAFTNDTPDNHQPPPSSDIPEEDMSDGMSYTSTLPKIFEVGMDNSVPPATGPWVIINHFTGKMIVDDEEVPPVAPGAPSALTNSMIQTEVILGVSILIQTSRPALLFVDQDERSDWLIRSTDQFLQHIPYYMCLNKVVDLFFAQEARLGHPDKVSAFYFLLPSLANNLFH